MKELNYLQRALIQDAFALLIEEQENWLQDAATHAAEAGLNWPSILQAKVSMFDEMAEWCEEIGGLTSLVSAANDLSHHLREAYEETL